MIAILQTLLALYYRGEMETFDLTRQDIALSVGLSLASLFFYSGLGIIMYGNKPKRLAWYISAVNSCTMFVHSIIYFYYQYQQNRISLLHTNPKSLFEARDNFSSHVCIWFMLANAWDVLFGLAFYPNSLNPLTTYIHHFVFIWICQTAIAGHHGFFITVPPFSRGLLLLSIEELPTCILSVGYLVPFLRNNLCFGLSFFFLRILFHAYIFHQVVQIQCHGMIAILFALSLLLHIHWFVRWSRKYGKNAFPFHVVTTMFGVFTAKIMPNNRNTNTNYSESETKEELSYMSTEPTTPASAVPVEERTAEEIAREDEELSHAAEAEALRQLALASLLPTEGSNSTSSNDNTVL